MYAAGLFNSNQNELLASICIKKIIEKFEYLTDVDIVLRKLVVAATMVMVVDSKWVTAGFGHEMDGSAVDRTYFLSVQFSIFLVVQLILFFLCCCFRFKNNSSGNYYLVTHCQSHLLRIYERTAMKYKENTNFNDDFYVQIKIKTCKIN